MYFNMIAGSRTRDILDEKFLKAHYVPKKNAIIYIYYLIQNNNLYHERNLFYSNLFID